MDELVEQRDRKLLAGKQLELVYRRFTFSFLASLLVSGGLVVALWPLVQPQVLLVWLLSLWLVMGARQFYAQRYLGLAQDTTIEHGKWIAGLVLGAVAAGACWGMTVLFLPATPLDAVAMMLIFVIAGVIGFASVTLAAVPLAAAAFMLPAVLPLAIWLCSFGERVYYFMGGIALTYLALMMVFSRQMHNVIRSSLSTSEQNKELAVALKQVKVLEYAAAQKENEQRYHELFANFEDSILFIDVGADGKFSLSSLNPAAERTFGMRDADARGKSKFDLFPADLAARLVEYDLACVESGRPLSYEDVLELPSGKRYFSVTQIPMRDESGRVYRIAAISRDITERKQMEEMLAAREREFRALVENAPDPIFRYDRECRRIFANQMVERTSGIPLAKLLGQTPTGTALVPSPESVKVQQSVQRVLDTGVADEVEVLFVAPDGSEIYFQNIHVPEFAADGSVQSVLSMGRDITARKYMETVLQKSEREYRMLAENAPDNIVRYDRECRIRYLNKNAEAVLGMPAGYLIDKVATEVFFDGSFDEFESALKGVIASGQGIDHYVTLPDTGNGERHHHVSISPERDEHGEVCGVLCIGRDITERKRMEDALVVRERQFRALAENTLDPIYRYDRDCRRIYVNPAVVRISGKPAEELLGSLPTDGAILVSEQNKNLMTKIRRVFESGEVEHLDIDYTSRSGERRDYRMMLVPERDDSGAVATVLGIARDVTDIRNVERRLSQFVANVPGYVYTYKLHSDGSRSFTFASPGIKELYGLTPEEVAADVDALHALVHPDDAARVAELVMESARSLTPYLLEHRINHPTKGCRWLESRAAPEVVGDGIQWHGMTMDITERKQAEQSLEKTHWLLRSVLQGIPDPVWMKDADGAFVVCNPGVARLFNKKEEEIIGKTDYDFFDAEMAEFYQNKDRTALEAGHVCINEEWWTFGDNGEQALMETRKVPVRGADGKLLGVLGVARDITERKQAVSHLEEARARLQTVMSTIPDMVWLKDADGAYLSCNTAFERLYGASEAEIIGKTDYDFVDAELADFFRQKDREAIEAGHICINEESIIYADDGRPGLMETRKVPVLGADGKVVGVLGVARDITERKQSEEKRFELQRQLQMISEHLPGAMTHYRLYSDLSGQVLYASKGLQDVFGLTLQDLADGLAPMIARIHPDDLPKAVAEQEHAARTLTTAVSEFRVNHPEKGEIWVQQITTPVLESENSMLWYSLMFDISERKSIEKAFRDSEHMLQEAQRIAHVGSWDVDMVNDKLVWSDEIFRIWEIDKTKFKADFAAFVETVHPEDRERVVQAYNDAVVNHSLYEVEHRLLFPDGRVKHILERGEPQYDAEGKPVRFIGTSLEITERKRMEYELHLKEYVLDQAQIGVYLIDEKARITYVNDEACRALGYSREELLAKTTAEIDASQSIDAALAIRHKTLADGAFSFETKHVRCDGSLLPVELLVSTLEYQGKTIGVALAADITERKRMQDELVEREREFRSLAENLPDNIARWDVQGRYLYVNPTHERLLGVAASEVLGKPLPDTHEHVKAAIAQVVATGQAVELVRQTVPVNGELQIHEVSIVPERDAAGRIVSVLGLGRNMTEYYRLRDEIAAREQEFRSLAENLPDNVVRWDAEGRYSYINPTLERVLGVPCDEVYGKRPCEAFMDGRFNILEAAVKQLLVTGGEKLLVRQTVPNSEGGMNIHEVSLAPEVDAEGRVIGVLGLGRDITDILRMQEILAAREEEFRALVEQAPEPIIRYAPDGRRIFVNAAVERITAIPVGVLLGELAAGAQLVSAQQGAAVTALVRRICETGEPAEVEVENVGGDGRLRHFHMRFAPEFGADGKVRSVLSICHDITARKLAERQLKETLEFSEGVINAIPDLLFEVDREGRYLNVWAQNQELLAAQKELLLGNTINEILSPEAAAVSMAAIREAEEKGLSLGKTMSLALPQGESWFELSVSRKSGSDTSAPHFLVLSRDVTERKLAEVALRASEALAQSRNELLQAIVESSPEIIVFALDTNYRYLSFNQKHKDVMAAIWGKEIAVGMNMLEVIGDHPDRKSAQRGMDRALAGESFVHEEAYGDEARSRQYWQNYWSPIRSDASQVVGLTCFVLNITERKKAEEAVRESGEKLRSLFELSPLGIALTDMQGRYVEINESFRAICGYPADELMTLDYWTLTPRQYEMQEIAQLESLAKTGRYGPYEKEYRQKDGTLVPIQLVGTLITGKDGQQHIWSIVEDIRERKRTEAELKERLDRIIELNDHLEKNARDLEDQAVELEAQAVELEASQEQIKQTEVWYRSILHSAPDGMLVVDDRGFIMLVNERLEAMFGYEHGELQGQAVEVLIPHAVRERHVDMRDGFISREDAYRQAAKTLFGCRKDGTEFPVDVSLSRLPEVEGMRSAICASVRDISARHAMEAAREAALEEVQHLAQLRSTFMAQMSHELRTPLNGILGYAQNLLQGDPLGEKQTAGLQIIQNSGEHLLTLINGILDHAAIEADKFELIPGDIELEPFLSTLIGIIRVRAEQKNLSFVCDAQTDLPAVVRGDAQRLRQVLLNLLANAVKFTDRGQVTLRVLCSAPSRLRFEVQDSGVGIVPEQLEAIFIPFEQGGEVSRRAGGTGLGLAISRKLVRLMGGDIKVESSPGTGSTFSFEIDMAAVHSGDEKVNAAALSEQAVTRVVHATSQLLAPPKAELDILHGSALRGNMRDVTKHADRLAAQDSRYLPFVEQLHQLAKGFQTKALLSLIEQYRNEDGGQP